MRRSSSFSHLPVPIFRMERSKSLSRISREHRPSIRTPISRPNIPSASASASAKLQINRLSNLKRPFSSLATPQSASRAKSPNYKSGLITEQYMKIRSYLQEQFGCDNKIMNNLKPLTISNFVDVIRLLLYEIHLDIEINTTNYKEHVLNILKMLNYPGTVSMSILKTVNTMHSWPYFINILAWLIDLIPLQQNLIETMKKQEGLVITIFSNVVTRFALYNENKHDENINRLDMELKTKLNNYLDINDGDVNELYNRVQKLREDNQDLSQNVQQYSLNLISHQNQIQQLHIELNSLFHGTGIEFNQQINDKDNEKFDIQVIIKNVKNNIETLKMEIDQQPFSVKDIKTLNDNIDQLKHTESLKKEKFQQLLLFLDDCDCQIVNLKKQIESKIFHLNSTLLPYKFIYPRCQILLVDENAIVSKDFLNQLKECCENQKIISSELDKDINSLILSIEKSKIKNDELKSINFQLKQELNELIMKEQKLLEEIKIYKEKIVQEMKFISNKKHQIQESFAELSSNDQNIDDLTDELEKVQKRLLQMKISLDESCVNSLKIFVQNHENLTKFADECVKIRSNVFQKLSKSIARIEDAQDKMTDDLKELEAFRKQ